MNNDHQTGDTILELRKISLRSHLGNHQLLNNISLKISHPEILGIIGSSGSGKSTLLKLLNYLHSHTEGDFFFEQKLVEKINSLELRRKIVLIPQEPKLLGMSVKSALVYPLKLQNFSPQDIQQRLSWCLNQFAIPDSWLLRQETELSVGQRHLVSIARGIIMQPKVLLLDEPTSSLDSGKAHRLQETLINLVKDQPMTIVVVNHDFDWLQEFVQRLVWLHQGSVKENLTIDRVDWKYIKKY